MRRYKCFLVFSLIFVIFSFLGISQNTYLAMRTPVVDVQASGQTLTLYIDGYLCEAMQIVLDTLYYIPEWKTPHVNYLVYFDTLKIGAQGRYIQKSRRDNFVFKIDYDNLATYRVARTTPDTMIKINPDLYNSDPSIGGGPAAAMEDTAIQRRAFYKVVLYNNMPGFTGQINTNFLYLVRVTTEEKENPSNYLQDDECSTNNQKAVMPVTTYQNSMDKITVAPNPYKYNYQTERGARWCTNKYEDRLAFNFLPDDVNSTIKVYTLAGDLVYEKEFDPTQEKVVFGYMDSYDNSIAQDSPFNLYNYEKGKITKSATFMWDMINKEGQKLAPGVYIYKVKSSKGEKVGKFVIIK